MRTLLGLCLALPLAACAPGTTGTSGSSSTGGALDSLQPSPLSQGIDQLYSQPDNWQQVADLAYGLVGYDTPPCATFMSFALRTLGNVDIPNVTYDGYGVRINTSGLSGYLEHKRDWQRVTDTSQLMPGDSIFVQPADEGSDHPAHTYMFHDWIDAQYAWVIDNESDEYCGEDEPGFVGFCDDPDTGAGTPLCCRAPGLRMQKRSITLPYDHKDADGDPDTDEAFWFALRAPADATAPDGGNVADGGTSADAGGDASQTDTAQN